MSFHDDFHVLTGQSPFPWQERLYTEWFSLGKIPQACTLPTGLGKTSIIPIWLIALARSPGTMPTRLVYVVNRRTVVDQTTDEVLGIVKRLASEPGRELAELLNKLRAIPAPKGTEKQQSPLAVSTLRGQSADNREWSFDPCRAAVICGTVDMIGSRLLFSGYGIGFKSKPLHAGFLGQDVLLVHDEAHLEPAFQRLVTSIEREQRENECEEDLDWPELQVMELTATARDGGESAVSDAENSPFALNDKDYQNETVQKRIHAAKVVKLHPVADENKELAARLLELALQHRDSGLAILVFARTVTDVNKVVSALKKTVGEDRVQQLTGTMRGWERDLLAKSDPIFARFLPESNRSDSVTPTSIEDVEDFPAVVVESNRSDSVTPTSGTVYLVATSAGEVGVNISADHLCCDLSTFESMAQRFGRVNRFGTCICETRIDIVHPLKFAKDDKVSEIDKRRQLTLTLMHALNGEGSPMALGQLDPQQRAAAFAPEPTYLPTTDILFDAWSLTTIKGKLPGRPPVEPYLHGLSDWEPPQTHVAWREEVCCITGELLQVYPPAELLEDYPLKPHELLGDQSKRIFDELKGLARLHPDEPVWLVDDAGEVVVLTMGKLVDDKLGEERIRSQTVLLSPVVGGLSKGLLSGTAAAPQRKVVATTNNDAMDAAGDVPKERTTAEQERLDVADELWHQPASTGPEAPEPLQLRVRKLSTDPKCSVSGMRRIRPAIRLQDDSEDDDSECEYWHWFERPAGADGDGSMSTANKAAVTWEHHTRDVTENANLIVKKLDLPKDLQAAIVLAARFHDMGKRRELWQRSIGNPEPTKWLAKSGAETTLPGIRTDYRHEFGSLLDVVYPSRQDEGEYRQAYEEFRNLDDSMRDVVLHLIAVHHGRGRPHFEVPFDPDRPQVEADDIASEVPRRYARLQRQYGRWGLAYLESLLRAADAAASADPSDATTPTEEARS